MCGADGRTKDTKAVIPDSHVRPLYQEIDRLLQDQRRVRPDDDGHGPERRADGAEGRGVRLARQDLRDPRGRRRRSSTTTRRGAARAGRRDGRHLAHACQTKDAPIRDWVKLAVTRARGDRHAGGVLARQERAHDARAAQEGRRPTWRTTTPRASTSRSCRRCEAMRFTLERAIRGRGHDLRHRQRAARLPHRPVPDPRARHQREDALDRAADGTAAGCSRPAPAARRPSTCSSSSRRTTCAGTRSASSSRWPRRSSTWATRPATSGPGCSATTLDAPTGKLLENDKSPVAQGRRARQPRQPLLPRAVLGAGARRADRGRGAGRALRPAGRDAGRERGDDRRRARRGAGRAGRHRRLLLPGPREGHGGDAAERDVQRGAGERAQLT